jgi:hypothetical protein
MAKTDYITTLQIGVELELVTCSECGVSFGLPTTWLTGRRSDHKTWYCPNGHTRYFPGKTKEEELRDELERVRKIAEMERKTAAQLHADKQRLRRQVSAQKGVATRLRNKAIAGVCAFCAHEFTDVAEHVKAEHPGEALEEDPE